MNVYVLRAYDSDGITPAFIKIGRTTYDDVRHRLHYYMGGLPWKFIAIYVRKFTGNGNRAKQLEGFVARELRDEFPHINREWFPYSKEVEERAVELFKKGKRKKYLLIPKNATIKQPIEYGEIKDKA